MFKHRIVGVVHSNLVICIMLLCPSHFGWLAAAHGDHVGTRHSVDQGVDVALAHTAEADDRDVEAFDHVAILEYSVLMKRVIRSEGEEE